MKPLYKLILLTFALFLSHYSFSQNKKLDSIKKSFLEKMKSREKVTKLKNKKIPPFKLQSLNSKVISSTSLKGKPTVINFWFDACQPCIDELPLFNKLQNQYKNKANFVAITFLNKEEANKFLKNHSFNFTHLINSKDYIKKVGVIGYPTTLLLDKNLIVKSINKKFTEKELDENIKTTFETQLISLINE